MSGCTRKEEGIFFKVPSKIVADNSLLLLLLLLLLFRENEVSYFLSIVYLVDVLNGIVGLIVSAK